MVRLNFWRVSAFVFMFGIAVSAQDFERVKNYLRTVPTVRAYVVDAVNFGLQKATIDGLKRFVELGFSGTIEIVYSDRSAEKVKVLTDNMRADFFPGVVTSYFSESEFNRLKRSNVVKTAKLGFVGGEGEHGSIDAAGLLVETLVKVEPAFHYSGDRSIEVLNGRVSDLPKQFFSLGFYEAFERAENLPQWLFDQNVSRDAPLAEFLKSAFNPDRQHMIMTAYGFHSIQGKIPTLAQFFSGIRKVQTQNPSTIMWPYAKPPPADLSPMEPPLKAPVVMIAPGLTLTAFEVENLKRFVERDTFLKGHVEVATPEEAIAILKLPSFKPGQILFVPTGWLNYESLRQLLVSGDLPATAGTGLMTPFLLQQKIVTMEVIQNIRQPQFESYSREARDLIADQTLDLFYDDPSRLPGGGIARFLLDYLSPNSELRQQASQHVLHNTERDIVFEAILKVTKKQPLRQSKSCNLS